MKEFKKFIKSPLLGFIFIFFSAGIFRLFYLDLIEYKFDEAFTIFELTKFYNSPYLMQIGPIQSTGVYNFPLYNYLMIILSLPSKNPMYLSFLIAFINTSTLGFFYLITRKFYGNTVAYMSSLIIAFSPWNILLSRKIWIPDLILPLAVFAFYFLNKVFLKKQKKDFLYLFLILSLMIQLHASGLFFAVTTVILLLLLKIKIDLREVMYGTGIGFLTGISYFYRQLTSSPFCIDCVSFFNYQTIPKNFDLAALFNPFLQLSGFGFNLVLGDDYNIFINSVFPLFPFNFFVFPVLLFSGLFLIIRKEKNKFIAFFILIFSMLFFLSRTPPHMQYFVSISIFSAITVAYLFKFLFNLKNNFLYKQFIFLIFIFIIFLNIVFQFSFFHFLSIKKEISGDYGRIYSETKKLVEKEIEPYLLLPFFNELKAYSFMFSNKKIINRQLGIYFLEKNTPNLAEKEFKKAVALNQKDSFSRANLAYLYFKRKDLKEAEKELKILKQIDPTTATKLEKFIKESEIKNGQ